MQNGAMSRVVAFKWVLAYSRASVAACESDPEHKQRAVPALNRAGGRGVCIPAADKGTERTGERGPSNVCCLRKTCMQPSLPLCCMPLVHPEMDAQAQMICCQGSWASSHALGRR